jgi:uncharacterized membrane protein YdjX (TVP38/TMEM64 family)
VVAVLLSRPIPLVAETITCMAGTARMPFRPFLVGQILGNLPLAFGYAWAGEFAGGRGGALFALSIAVMVPATLWFLWAATRTRRRRE